MVFRKLGLIEPLIRIIEDEKFEKPSEIQEKTIPLILAGKDVIAGSATGSGKTLAFGAGIIQNLERKQGLQTLVLTPTRELAEQVSKALIRFSKYKPFQIITVYGGVSINPQIDALRYADVAVGTPGRILDHLERRTINLSKVKILVLDEADRMFDMGFIDDVKKIISQCPKQRQTLMFSATITDDVYHISKNYMQNPIKVSAEQYVDPRKMKQVYYDVPDNMKFSLLVHLLKNEESGLVMVFCNTRRNVDIITSNLKSAGIDAMAIHGGLSQNKRTRTMDIFHSQKAYALVCTDVAARGLDIKGVSHVYNYDIPKDSKEYIHRIGRTARAGKEGKVINILSSRDHDNFSRVMRDNDVNIVKEEMPRVENVPFRWMKDTGFRGGGFQRGHGRGQGGRDGRDNRFGRDRPRVERSERSNADSKRHSFGSRRFGSSSRR